MYFDDDIFNSSSCIIILHRETKIGYTRFSDQSFHFHYFEFDFIVKATKQKKRQYFRFCDARCQETLIENLNKRQISLLWLKYVIIWQWIKSTLESK